MIAYSRLQRENIINPMDDDSVPIPWTITRQNRTYTRNLLGLLLLHCHILSLELPFYVTPTAKLKRPHDINTASTFRSCPDFDELYHFANHITGVCALSVQLYQQLEQNNLDYCVRHEVMTE